MPLDATGRTILNELKADGRLSNQARAPRVHLVTLRLPAARKGAGRQRREELERFHAEVQPRLPGVLRSNSMRVL